MIKKIIQGIFYTVIGWYMGIYLAKFILFSLTPLPH